MPLPKLDPTINVGHILIIMSVAASVLFAYTDLRAVDAAHNTRLLAVEKTASNNSADNKVLLNTLSDIKSDLAVIKDRSDRAENLR